jgi:hypothetical protein
MRRAVLVAAVAIGVAGCAAEPERPAGADVVTTAAAPTRTTPTTTTTPPPLPAAADGTEVGACADGTCEVLVSGQVEIPVPGEPITVVTIRPAGVDLRTVGADGFTTTFTGQRPDQGGPSVLGEVSVAVVAISGSQAVLRIAPA